MVRSASAWLASPWMTRFLHPRLEIIKRELPSTSISIATNCGLFDAEKHGFIIDYASYIGVHIASVEPEVCCLDIALTHDGVIELRIGKRGGIGFIHSGTAVRALGEDEALESPDSGPDRVNRPLRQLLRRRISLQPPAFAIRLRLATWASML